MITALPRTVLRVTGESAKAWLDGLLTNTVAPEGATFAALLTPQGKIIADMMVSPTEGGFLLDTPEAMGAGLLKRLKMYVLREPLSVEDVSGEMTVHQVFDAEDVPEGAVRDPRHASLGHRLIAEVGMGDTPLEEWDRFRLTLGVPLSQFDYGPLEVFPADACMDELNGVDLHKGCFVGQEVVSRMHRLSSAKKRMRAVVLRGDAKTGDSLMAGTRRVGDLLHVRDRMGMALLRLDRLENASELVTVNGKEVDVMGGPNG